MQDLTLLINWVQVLRVSISGYTSIQILLLIISVGRILLRIGELAGFGEGCGRLVEFGSTLHHFHLLESKVLLGSMNVLFQEVNRLTINVALGLQLLAPVAVFATTEVVVLADGALPASVWEVEGTIVLLLICEFGPHVY